MFIDDTMCSLSGICLLLLGVGKETVSILSLSNQVGGLKEIVIQSFLHLSFYAKCLSFFPHPVSYLDMGPLTACKQTPTASDNPSNVCLCRNIGDIVISSPI